MSNTPDNRFEGESLSAILHSLAEEGELVRIVEGDIVQITEEGFDTLMALLAVAALSAKPPINQQAQQLGESIGRELHQWNARRN